LPIAIQFLIGEGTRDSTDPIQIANLENTNELFVDYDFSKLTFIKIDKPDTTNMFYEGKNVKKEERKYSKKSLISVQYPENTTRKTKAEDVPITCGMLIEIFYNKDKYFYMPSKENPGYSFRFFCSPELNGIRIELIRDGMSASAARGTRSIGRGVVRILKGDSSAQQGFDEAKAAGEKLKEYYDIKDENIINKILENITSAK
jgi:hypothetical protein